MTVLNLTVVLVRPSHSHIHGHLLKGSNDKGRLTSCLLSERPRSHTISVRFDRTGQCSLRLVWLHGGISQMATRSMLTSMDVSQGVVTCRQTYAPTRGRTVGQHRLTNGSGCRTRRRSVQYLGHNLPSVSRVDRHQQSSPRVWSSGFSYCREDAANQGADKLHGLEEGVGGGGDDGWVASGT